MGDSVPTRILSMRKIREVLRLHFELGLGQRAIARACSIRQSTVHDYLNRAAAAGMGWLLGEEWAEQRVGEVWPALLFVMVLGASSYTYAEATRDQQLTAWISAHVHAFEYFSGVPRLLTPDNLRTGVSRACRYDPDLNPTYQEFALHYEAGVVPSPPRHPMDQTEVEVCVQ